MKDSLKSNLSHLVFLLLKQRTRDLLVIEVRQGGTGMNPHVVAILTIVALGFGAWIVGH